MRAARINPFVHYLREGIHENRTALSPPETGGHYEAQDFATQAGPLFEEFDPGIAEGRTPLAKVLAYYLPQFHAIPENDGYWGDGFTEWRNVARGQPRYNGHVQPRIPRDLGHYCLDDPEIMRRQIEMARAAGLHGFCYYYYSFGGHRVLEKPIENLLKDPSLDFPFTLMWANENWTRTWDGMDKEILLEQDYDPAKNKNLVADLARHFEDPRYIRIGGRPLFFVYRPGQIPNAAVTIEKWRRLFLNEHDMSPLILMVQGFDDHNPDLFGLDGAIEFPPHKICQGMTNAVDTLELLDPNFGGHVLQYDEVIARSAAVPVPDFPLIRATTPYWDNEARRPGRGMMMVGSTPEKFGAWLKQTIKFARQNPVEGEAIVAVNAWNEWAEGAYLEPDIHYGAAYLNALSRAVHGVPSIRESTPSKVVIVGHDANRHGAQILVANLARTMSQQFGLEVVILLCASGPMVKEYEALCETHVLHRDPNQNAAQIGELAARGFTRAIVNTTVSGLITPHLKEHGFHVTNLIHELGRLIEEYDLQSQAKAIAEHSDHIVFPAPVVRDSFPAPLKDTIGSVEIQPQGLYRATLLESPRDEGGVRAELDLPANAKIVLNVGYADLRKGFDQFVATAQILSEYRDDVYFVWLGGVGQDIELWFMPGVKASKHAERFRFLGHVEDVERWYGAADVFFLSAREDPFPSAVLEAIAAGMPVVGYTETGGCDPLIARHGMLVPPSDNAAAAKAIDTLLDRPQDARDTAAQTGKAEIMQHYLFDTYAHGLLAASQGASLARVSVIVPNFNYALCLEERLLTVFNQSYPVFEIIVMDDASTDDSVAVINRTARAQDRQIDLVVNKDNSGSPFKQWLRGLDKARGEFIWIAEADDVADPDFLRTLMDTMQAEGSDLGFSDSWQIDQNGEVMGTSYIPYANSIRGSGFEESFTMSGKTFLERFLAVKNIILNVSCVVFRKDALKAAIERIGTDLDDMRVAGDWRIYAEICASDSNITFEARALNGHRRHASSVTHALNKQRHMAEITGMQKTVSALIEVDAAGKKAQKIHIKEARAHLGLTPADEDQENLGATSVSALSKSGPPRTVGMQNQTNSP